MSIITFNCTAQFFPCGKCNFQWNSVFNWHEKKRSFAANAYPFKCIYSNPFNSWICLRPLHFSFTSHVLSVFVSFIQLSRIFTDIKCNIVYLYWSMLTIWSIFNGIKLNVNMLITVVCNNAVLYLALLFLLPRIAL